MRKCTKCKKEKPIQDFSKKKKGVSSWCRECQSDYSKCHYANNKKKYQEKSKRYDNDFREWVDSLKDGKKCIVCGESRVWVLDYHHKGNKSDNIGTMKWAVVAKHKVLDEIRKCDILCSNCHRNLHYMERVKNKPK